MIEVNENTITIIRGDSGYITVPLIEIVDGEEVPYEPNPGDKLRFAASSKWGANEDECFIIREIPLTTNATIDASKVLNGYKAYGPSGLITGTATQPQVSQDSTTKILTIQ